MFNQYKLKQKPKKSRWDLILSRIAYIAQFIVAASAVFSMFYVVIPVFQKELLSEKLAETQKQYNIVKSATDSLAYLKDVLIDSLNLVNNRYDTANIQLRESRFKLDDLEIMKNILISKNSGLENNLNLKLNELKDSKAKIMVTYLKEYNLSVSLNYSNLSSKYAGYEIITTNDYRTIKFNFDFQTYPIKALLEAINLSYTDSDHNKTGSIPNEIVNSMKKYCYEEVSKIPKIEGQNYNIIADNYKKESIRIEKDYKDKLEKHRQEYDYKYSHPKIFNQFSDSLNNQLNRSEEEIRKYEKNLDRHGISIIELDKDREYLMIYEDVFKTYFDFQKKDIKEILHMFDQITYNYFNNNENWFNLINK